MANKLQPAGGAILQALLDLFFMNNQNTYSVSGAIDPHPAELSVLNGAAALAMTLGAPTVGSDENKIKVFVHQDANADVITATGLFQDGAGHLNTATFAADAGGSIGLIACQGKWVVLWIQGVTMG